MNSREYLIACWQHELPATIACFRAIPADKSGYTPNPKTRTAKEIVEHLIGHPLDVIEAIDDGVMHHRVSTPVNDISKAADEFAASCETLFKKLASVDEHTWNTKLIPFYFYGREVESMQMPLRDIAWQLFKDEIHHRGQLSTYFRPMGVPNPAIYGLTREILDEMMAAAAK